MHTSSFAQPPPAPGLAFAIPIAAVDILRCFTSDVTGVIKFDELGDVTMVLLLAWPVCIAPPAPCSAATMLPLPTLCGDDKSPPLGFLNFENNFRTKWSCDVFNAGSFFRRSASSFSFCTSDTFLNIS